MLLWIENSQQWQEIQKKHQDFLVVMFYGDFSSAAKRALAEIEQFSKENEKVPVCVVDVMKVKNIHKQLGVEKVPTVVALKEGKIARKIEGVESSRFYAQIILGAHPERAKISSKKEHRIIVYTGQGCPACSAVKSYLRSRQVNFREIDVSSNQREAERLVRRSGQMAVPQIDIDGRLIVGFDRGKIDALLAS